MIYVSILLTILNIIFLIVFSNKYKSDNLYIKEKNEYYLLKYRLFSNIINIFYIFSSVIYYLGLYIYNDFFDVVTFIFFLIALASYISFLLIKKNIKRSHYFNKKLLSSFDYLVIISSFIIIVYGISFNKAINALFFSILFIANIFILILSFQKNKGVFCYKSSVEDYIEDIKFIKKIEYNKLINYIIYILAYISFVYIRIIYIEIFYLLVLLILMYIIFKKYKKIVSEQNRLYRSITILHVAPGIKYAFDFTRDLLLLKELFITLLLFIISISSLYGLGERAFMAISVILYVLLLYVRLSDRVYLIRYINSLNDEFIDNKRYSIKEKKLISFIDVIIIFDIKLYRLIIIDNLIYKSNLIMYDPEYLIEDLELRINKFDLSDYITIENKLYEE
ncbi:MAG: hypothetical protein IJ568_00980 [Bacilli bacterium]|nr:hypothetical protein [Bacilli bacterium]